MNIWHALALACILSAGLSAQEYAVDDITEWSESQLQTLPHFHDFLPLLPPGADPAMLAVAHTPEVAIGTISYSNVFVQQRGVVVADGNQQLVSALGTFNWARTWWDGQDYHFANGFVNDLALTDLNTAGWITGTSTIAGSGSYAYEATRHAVLRDPDTGLLTDLTPAALQSTADAINASGQIAGTLHDGSFQRAYRRTPAGELTLFGQSGQAVRPRRINDNGWIVGRYTLAGKARPFISTGDSSMVDLGLPSQGSPDSAIPASINSWGQIAGRAYRADTALEANGCLWLPDGAGGWEAFDINEMLANNDAIIESLLAINDEGYLIASGRQDGTDLFGSRLYFLTPDSLNPPWPVAPPLHLDVQYANEMLHFSWNSAGAGWSYTLEVLADAASGVWSPAPGVAWPVAETMVDLALSGLPSGQQFRLVARFGQIP